MKFSRIAACLFLNLSLLIGAAATGRPQEPKAPQKPKQEEPAPSTKAAAPALVSVPADEVFIEVYENYQWVLHEIDRIERAQGTTEIPFSIRDLRVRAQAKLTRLRGWMGEHKVPETWVYNSDTRVFNPQTEAVKK